MPRPRFHKLASDKQQRILDAAIAVFAESGYYEASFNQIIERAGISKGAMYYYFDDKTDLYVTVLESALEEKIQAFGELDIRAEDDDPFWDAMGRLFVKALAWGTESPELLGLARSYAALEPGELGHRLDGLMASAADVSMKWLVAGQEQGAVRTDLPMQLLVELMFRVDETIDRYFLSLDLDLDDESELERIADLYLDIMKRLLVPRWAVGRES